MKILMCPPLYYEPVEGEDASTVMAEWRGLYRLLRDELGMQVDLLEPRPGMPKLVLAANGGFVSGDSFIASRFRDVSRRLECEAWNNFFLVRGYVMQTPAHGCCLEGQRDLVDAGGTLFLGYRSNSDLAAHSAVSAMVDREVLPLRLSGAWDWPLDACLCPFGDGKALYRPEAFDASAREVLAGKLQDLKPVDPDDALRMGCNALIVDGNAILPEGCHATAAQLEQQGFQVYALPLGAYARHGAGPKALVLRIDD